MLSTPSIIAGLLSDLISWFGLIFCPRTSLEAEVLFLRRQLALYVERGVRPRRIDALTRVRLSFLSRWFDGRSALVIVQPGTLIRWHRAGFKLFWRWKSRPGRPPIPKELRELLRRIARENPLWGEERIANELLVKLALRVSPRTVRKYMRRPPGQPRGDRRWSTFLKNHAHAIVACDFFVAVTSTFKNTLRVHRHRASNPKTDSLQRDGAPQRRMDTPAVARGRRLRASIRVPDPRPRLHLLR